MKSIERSQYLAQIVHLLRPRQVLDYYSVSVKNDTRRSKKGKGVELDCVCPFHPSSTMNFSMNSESGKWFCRSALCGKRGDLIRFVALKEGCSDERAFQQLCFMADVEPTSIDSLSIAMSMFDVYEGEPTFSAKPKAIKLPRHYRVFAHPYLVTARLLDPNILLAAEAGGIHFDPFYKYRACIPVKRDGKVHSIYSRRVSDNVDAWKRANPKVATQVEKMFRKHDYTGHTLTSHLLYGLDEVDDDTLILVEAIISVLRLRSLGIFNAVAMLKADLSSEQIQQIITRGFSKVLICNDNDIKMDVDTGKMFNPGMKAAWKNYYRLRKHSDVGIMKLEPNRDPADTADPFTREEFLMHVDGATFPKRRDLEKIKDWFV